MRFAHKRLIRLGVRGETSKIREELDELEDTESPVHAILELSDILDATGQYARKKLRCPLFVIVALCYVRTVYKPIRNFILDRWGQSKESHFPKR